MHINSSFGKRGFVGCLLDKVLGLAPAAPADVPYGVAAKAVGVNCRPLGAEQAAARAAALEWLKRWRRGDRSKPFFYIAGYAGTGKSTLTASIIESAISDLQFFRVIGIGFTAQSARVLLGKTPALADAMTAHRALYRWVVDENSGKGRFVVDRNGPAATAHLIVLDEISMINGAYGRDLMSLGVPIICLGDVGIDGEVGQLPPVTGTCYFEGVRPDAILREVHRTARESGVVRLTEMVRNRQLPPPGVYGEGVVVLPLTAATQPLIYRPETQSLCGKNKVRWVYTQRIRRQRGLVSTLPLAGEKILWRKNLRNLGLSNGMVGTMVADAALSGDGLVSMNLRFDDLAQPVVVDCSPHLFQAHFQPMGEAPVLGRGQGLADWANVRTGHQVQGSEFTDVTVIDDSSAFREWKFHWLYSTLTRTSDRLTLLMRY